MARKPPRICTKGGCWAVVQPPAHRCEDHANPAAPSLIIVDEAQTSGPPSAWLQARNAERERAAKARAKAIKDAERELAETAAFKRRLQETGAVPRED